mmetsp:Transcript_10021/g.15156  ORF Transcript_10021/g.15156 Transcript_10021/m.15156 type:complete len:293 (-) Transcript_10021:400-1278(-)
MNELSFQEGGEILFIISMIFVGLFAIWWGCIGGEFCFDYENIRINFPTVSSYYSDKETYGYCRRYVPGIIILVVFLSVANTLVFIVRYAQHGEELMDILSYSALIFSSVISILLLYPLVLKAGQGCCRAQGINEVRSACLHQCGGLFLLCAIPVIEFIIYAVLIFHFRHEKITNWVSFAVCLFLLFCGATLYLFKVFLIDEKQLRRNIAKAIRDDDRNIVDEENLEVIYPDGYFRLGMAFCEFDFAIHCHQTWGWLSCCIWKNPFFLWFEWAYIAAIVTAHCLFAVKKVLAD